MRKNNPKVCRQEDHVPLLLTLFISTILTVFRLLMQLLLADHALTTRGTPIRTPPDDIIDEGG